jgi:hypothetical protein
MGFWAEQYLLQAYLADNQRCEVLLSLQALHRERRDALWELVPRLAQFQNFPTGFWLRMAEPPRELRTATGPSR